MRSDSLDAAVVEKAAAYLSPSMRLPFPEVVVEGGSGSTFWTPSGRRYLDLHAMAAVMNVGYAHPGVVAAVRDQLERFVHCNPAYAIAPPVVELAETLATIAPGDAPKRVVFGLSGSDANDGAIKLVRAATGRTLLIAFSGAYHGNTYGALSLSAVTPAMRKSFAPTLPGVFHAPFPRIRASDAPERVEEETELALEGLLEIFRTVAPPDDVAAIFIEPVQGDSGVFVPPAAYVRRLAEIASAHGILLVAEEVQTGVGRTGRLFGIEHFGVTPDVLVLGKALGGGFPISAVVAPSELMDHWRAPGHVFSTSAGPVAASAASAVLRAVAQEGLCAAAVERGAQLREGLNALAERFEVIRDVRGAGLMLGVELDAGGPGAADATRMLAAQVVKGCLDRGCFLTFLAGSVLRLVPPLVITAAEVDRALQVMEESLAAAVAGSPPAEEVRAFAGW